MPKGVESINYEGVSFNKTWVAGQTLAAFQEHEAHHGLSEAQLKEVHQIARGKKEVEDVKLGEVDTPTVLESVSGVNLEKEAPAKNGGGKRK
jgi:hypothetical protein